MPPTSTRYPAGTVVLTAPLSGRLVPIDEVPDPVFAQRLVGNGVSIDPTDHTLCAPCAGRIVQVHAAGHAVTLATAEGLEVMMHIGLDTMKLNGHGFSPHVAAGDEVVAGQPLIDFDAAFVTRHARSLLTQVVIMNGERVAKLEARRGPVVAGADVALEVTLKSEAVAAADGRGGLVDDDPPGKDAAGDEANAPPPQAPAGRCQLAGVAASPGLVAGRIVQVARDECPVVDAGGDPHRERSRLEHALERAKAELDLLVARLRSEAGEEKAGIFLAHRGLLDDPELLAPTLAGIDAGHSAGAAWHEAYAGQAERVARLRHPWLAARATDIRDVGSRVLRHLVGSEPVARVHPAGAVLVAEDLTPSEVAGLDRASVLGFCTVAGSAASHVAILARSLGLPVVTSIEASALDVPSGTPAILDGSRGLLVLNPAADEVRRVDEQHARDITRRARDLADAATPAVTTDGQRVEVVANIADLADAVRAVGHGAEGVGLVRSEFLFGHRPTAPTEDEQYAAYCAVVSAMGPDRRVVIRTLDAGGDKPIAYVPIPVEPNPSLGERGTRALLDRPELLRPQLRAILRASRFGRVSVMFPMIATVSEWRVARQWVEEERSALGVAPIPIGIVVEVAAAALLAEHFAREVDFFSVGTNDLAQYTLAMDRGHPRLASQVDGLHPAVLQLIARTVAAARAHGKPVSICGGIASDPQAVPILIGLGADQLSVPVPVIAPVKAQVRRLSLAECRGLAARALEAETAAAVRAMVPAHEA